MPPPAGRGHAQVKQARRLLCEAQTPNGSARHRARPDFTRQTAQCLCGAPRDTHSGPRHGGGHPETRCRRYRRDPAYDLAYEAWHAREASHVDVVNAWQEANYPRPQPRPGGTGVGPSDHGTCKRQIQYRELGLPEGYEEDEVNELAAIIGQLIHDALLRAYGHKFQWRYYERYVRIPGLHRLARVDMYDPVTGILSDVKTKGEHGWEQLAEFGPLEEEWKQLATYAWGLSQPLPDGTPGETPETLHIIAVRRSDGTVEHFYRDYDEKYALAAVGELKALNANLELARLGLLELPRPAGAGITGKHANIICKHYCRYKTACWKIPQAQAAGRSPESYAFLGDPLDHAEVEYAAGTLREWRRASTQADKEKKRTATLLAGVPDGDYGKYRVTNRKKHTPLYAKYHQAVRDAIDRGATAEEINNIPLEYSHSDSPDVQVIRYAERHPTTPDAPQESPRP